MRTALLERSHLICIEELTLYECNKKRYTPEKTDVINIISKKKNKYEGRQKSTAANPLQEPLFIFLYLISFSRDRIWFTLSHLRKK